MFSQVFQFFLMLNLVVSRASRTFFIFGRRGRTGNKEKYGWFSRLLNIAAYSHTQMLNQQIG